MPPGSILSVSYNLRPPSSTSTPPTLSPTTTHEFPLKLTSNSPPPGPSVENESPNTSDAQFATLQQSYHHDYYAALRDAIAEAKTLTGRELTEWRDAVGDREKEKVEVKRKREGVDEEDEGEEGVEEEGAEEEEAEEGDQGDQVEVKIR